MILQISNQKRIIVEQYKLEKKKKHPNWSKDGEISWVDLNLAEDKKSENKNGVDPWRDFLLHNFYF